MLKFTAGPTTGTGSQPFYCI